MKKDRIKRVLTICMIMIFSLSATFTFANVNPSFSITSSKEKVTPGGQFVITLAGKDITDLYAFEVALLFDETKLEIVGKPSIKIPMGLTVGPKRASDGKTYFGHTKIGEQPSLSEDLKLCDITFRAKVTGNHTVEIDTVTLIDSNMNSKESKLNEIVNIRVTRSSSDDDYSDNSQDKDKDKDKDKNKDKDKGQQKDQDIVLVPGDPKRLTDIDNHWAKKSINKVVKSGHMVGRSKINFSPEENLTRAEMAAILNRIVPFKATTASQFEDVKGNEWYAQSIVNMTSIGILGGYGDNKFKPKENIKRSEVMAVLARVSKYNDEYQPVKNVDDILSAYNDFTDIPQWAKKDVAWCVQEGIIGGDNEKKINANADITRAEIAAVLSRVLELED